MKLFLRGCCIPIFSLIVFANAHATSVCDTQRFSVQVLGSGGPELAEGRAASSYIIWHQGKARVMIDMGGGSMLRFNQSKAQPADLEAILFTHLHVDHSSDLPALIKSWFFFDRDTDLNIYGPTGNNRMPSMTKFVRALFGVDGAYKYLHGYMDGSESFRLVPHDVPATGKTPRIVVDKPALKLIAVPVHHGPIPAVAWRVILDNKSVVFSGDMNNDTNTNILAVLAQNADLLVAHHAIPEESDKVARNLHMPPSVIGKIAAQAGVKRLVLSHRMLRTRGKEAETENIIKRIYHGPVHFADDMQCFNP